MKKFFRFDSRRIIPLLCILGLVVVALIYLFVYIPSNEGKLIARRFRALQRLESNIDAKTANSFALIKNLANANTDKQYDTAALREYMRNAFPEHKRKLVFDTIIVSKKQPTDSLSYNEKSSGGYLSYEVTPEESRIHFVCKKYTPKKTISIAMDYGMSEFFLPLLPSDLFDEYLIISNESVVLETFPSGITSTRFDSLLQYTQGIAGSSKNIANIGGTDYHLFVQPVSLDGKNKWLAIGLLSSERFDGERNQLPTGQVLAVIIIGILMIILMPWFKLFLMAPRDRLTVIDGAASFVVAMLLMSLLFFVFARWGTRLQRPTEKASLQYMADSIDARFEKSLQTMKYRLDSFNALLCRNDSLHINIRNIDKESIEAGNILAIDKGKSPSKDTLQLIRQLCTNNIYQVFWLNKENGTERYNWNVESLNAPHNTYRTRKYFIEQLSDSAPAYSFDQVVSWTTGSFRTILSKQSGNPDGDIACLSFRMEPVSNVLLPTGYSFAILNQAGDVLYHADSTHNLNENLIEEIDEGPMLTSMIFGKLKGFFTSLYNGERTKFYVKPMSGANQTFGLTLVVMEQENLSNIRETGVFSFSVIMLCLFFLIVAIQLVVVVVVSSQRSMLKSLGMDTEWIWPLPSSKSVYVHTNYFNATVLVLLWIAYFLTDFIQYFFFLLVAVCAITLFINHLFATKYHQEGKRRYFRYKARNLVALYSFMVMYNLLAIRLLQASYWTLLLFEGTLIVTGWFWWRNFRRKVVVPEAASNNHSSSPSGENNPAGFVRSYAIMAMSRLLITSGIPVFFFFQYAFNYEQALAARFRQYNFLKALKTTKTNSPDSLPLNAYQDGYWIQSIGQQQFAQKHFTRRDSITADVLDNFRIYSNKYTVLLDGLSGFGKDANILGYDPEIDKINQATSFSTSLKMKDGIFMHLSSANIRYKFPSLLSFDRPFTSFVYWISLLLAVGLLFFLIIKVIRRIFALDLPGDPSLQLLKRTPADREADIRLLYVTGLPGAGKMKFVLQRLRSDKAFIIDLFAENQVIPKEVKTPVVILNHFEYCTISIDNCGRTVDIMESLMSAESRPRIIIVSSLDHAILLGKLDQLRGGQDGKVQSLRERLRVMLGHFTVMVLPIQFDLISDASNSGGIEFRKIWEEEFSRAHMLQRIGKGFKDVWSDRQEIKDANESTESLQQTLSNYFSEAEGLLADEYSWQVNIMAGHFYSYIWQSLSPEERYLVYDLAEEGLVNMSNSYHLSLLLQKGLVRRREPGAQLELLNTSFRNFVLNSVDRNEALQLQHAIKSEASWNEFKIPLLIVIVGVLALLLVSQQQSYSKIVGYLTALAAIIPTLNTIFGFVKPAPGKGD